MTTFEEEINELKTQEEAQAEDVQEVEQGEEDLTGAESEEVIEAVKVEPSEEEKKAEEARIKQEAYNKRKEARAKKQEETSTRKVENPVAPDELEALKQVARQMQGHQMYQNAKKELATLENDFSEVYTDYKDVVDRALAFTKQTLVSQGLSEAEAEAEAEKQKVIIADRAAASGHDPVEVVYKKAQSMNKAFELYAEKMGYKKVEKETNLDKVRKITNPTAVNAGGSSGKGSQKSLRDDAKAIVGMTIGELLKASKEGRL